MSEQDDFSSAEEKAAKESLQNLTEKAHEGALFSNWTKSYCTQQFFKWLDEQILDSRNRWLQENANAVSIQAEARAFVKVKKWVNAQIGIGTVAALGIKRFHEEGVELEGLIKPPTDNG
jgi:hypothetical protein